MNPTDAERTKLELKAYAEQQKLISERFDEKAAEMANYGWGVDCLGSYTSIATKVYRGDPYTVLVSLLDFSDGTIEHEWRS